MVLPSIAIMSGRKNMKSLLVLLVFVSSSSAFAQRLFECNPPTGSSLQNVEISKSGNSIFVRELNSYGAWSQLKEIPASSWTKKDLKWTSPDDGDIHLYKDTQGSTWYYDATGDYGSVKGYCDAG